MAFCVRGLVGQWFPILAYAKARLSGQTFLKFPRPARSVIDMGVENIKLFPKSAFLSAEERVKISGGNF